MTPTLTPNTPITAENVGLLKAGDWLIRRHDATAVQYCSSSVLHPDHALRVFYSTGGSIHGNLPVHAFAYIGPDLGDGWIGAPEGGWLQSPVPRMFVEWQNADLDEGKCWSDELRWMDKWPVVAFRPAPPNTSAGSVAHLTAAERAYGEDRAAPMIARPMGVPMTPELSAAMDDCMAATYPGDEPNTSAGPVNETAESEHGVEGEYRQAVRDANNMRDDGTIKPVTMPPYRYQQTDLTGGSVSSASMDAPTTNMDAPKPAPVDWARCQRCGGEIQGWICQQCHQEFEENDAGELVFCPSESVDWAVVGPKLVEAITEALCLYQTTHIHIRLRAALAAVQPGAT